MAAVGGSGEWETGDKEVGKRARRWDRRREQVKGGCGSALPHQWLAAVSSDKDERGTGGCRKPHAVAPGAKPIKGLLLSS